MNRITLTLTLWIKDDNLRRMESMAMPSQQVFAVKEESSIHDDRPGPVIEASFICPIDGGVVSVEGEADITENLAALIAVIGNSYRELRFSLSLPHECHHGGDFWLELLIPKCIVNWASKYPKTSIRIIDYKRHETGQ